MANELQDVDIAAAVVRGVAYGRAPRDVAAEYGMTVEQVKSIIDRAAVAWFGGDNLRREMLLEVERLSALAKRAFIEALKGDMNAALLYLKICERRSILTGMTPVQGHAITIINSTAAPQQQTSTAEIASIIDEIRALPKH